MGEKHNWDFNEGFKNRVKKAVDSAAPIRKMRYKTLATVTMIQL